MSERVWFMTEASAGLQRRWAIPILEQGDKIAATARDARALDDLVETYGDRLLPIELDIANRADDFAAIAQAHDHFGRLDVVVNNAGYCQLGRVDELSEREVRDQMETNFFGALWISQAALPYLRQSSGHLIQVSSIWGVTAFPNVGIYTASKWALAGLSEALAMEMAALKVRVTLIEAGVANDCGGDYYPTFPAPLTGHTGAPDVSKSLQTQVLSELADPNESTTVLLRVVEAADPPLRVFVGISTLSIVSGTYDRHLRTWQY
jgi:NADP-dependent 3-hydroxy acid dehydrogenase YdfG